MSATGTPFTCLHPKYVVNPYTHQKIASYCGECAACVARKARRYETQIQLEAKNSASVLFVTLTYANSYVPKLDLVPVAGSSLGAFSMYNAIDSDTGEVFDTLTLNRSDVKRLMDKTFLFGKIPYLDKKAIQKFMKRLRKSLSEYNNEKIRYFLCGEYGPDRFRPHSISYYSSSQEFSSPQHAKRSQRTFLRGLGSTPKTPFLMRRFLSSNALYVRLGDSVVSMPLCPKETVHSMLRRMLTVLAIFPKFFVSAKPNRSRVIQGFLVSNFVKRNVKKCMRLPLSRLCIEACRSLAFIRSLTCPFRIQMCSFPNAKVMLLKLIESVCSLIVYTSQQGKNSLASR